MNHEFEAIFKIFLYWFSFTLCSSLSTKLAIFVELR